MLMVSLLRNDEWSLEWPRREVKRAVTKIGQWENIERKKLTVYSTERETERKVYVEQEKSLPIYKNTGDWTWRDYGHVHI